MIPEFGFDGHIYQVLEALDYGDAVSNQAIELDAMLHRLGFSTSLHSKWYHENVKDLRSDIEGVVPTERDVVIFHFSGYSEYVLPIIESIRCTKVCIYHNITPHSFFQSGTPIYEHCLKGREQLLEISRSFHYFWGDSSFNNHELIELGVEKDRCSILPIIIRKHDVIVADKSPREIGSWIFLGRVAANKGHLDLVQAFANTRNKKPQYANKLYIVGGYQATDPYYQKLVKTINSLKLGDCVIFTGKVTDEEVKCYLDRASIYVSMSLHEGFGVPLIEAVFHDLPVVALKNTAVGETMGNGMGLANSSEELRQLIVKALEDKGYLSSILDFQKNNASRFFPEVVEGHLINALSTVIPVKNKFKSVSIVICTINRADLLYRCLDYLQYQTNCNFEVIVVNGPSSDSTNEVLIKYKDRIKIGHNPERNLSVSRNIGIELSSGDLIAFIDDDALPFDDWVNTLLFEFNRRPLSLAGLGGPVFYAGSLEYQAQDIGINRFAESKINIDSTEIGTNGWERSLLGTNTCFNAYYLINAGGFDEQFDYFLDESELCYRLQQHNYIVGYCPNLFLRHEFAQSHNRSGKYNYNWYTICKNTTYYIAAYSGLKGNKLESYINHRMETDRIAALQIGRNAGEISNQQYTEFTDAIWSGVKQGLIDVNAFPRLRSLHASTSVLLTYISTCIDLMSPLPGCGKKRLHICVVTKEFPPFAASGGIGTLYYHLVSELLLMGHFITVVTPSDEDSSYIRGRLTVRFTKRSVICSDNHGGDGFVNNTNWSLSALHAVAALHNEQPIDIIESALWDSEGLAISLLEQDMRPPLVVRLVTPFPVAARLNGWSVPEREGKLFRAAEQAVINGADAVIPISDSIALTIEQEYGIIRDSRWKKSLCGIAYWPYFDSHTEYTEIKEINGCSFKIPENAKLIVFVGRLESRKGVDLLLSAANEFLTVDSQAQLLLAGRDIEGWSQRSTTILSNELASRVHFFGEVDDSTRDKLLHAAYCVVFPSRYESFGLVPLEAFVHGTPVIATNAGAISEVVADEECGLLFEPENPGYLAKCVIRMLAEPRLRDRLSAGARKQIRHFSSRNSAINSVKLYASLLLKEKLPSTPKHSVITAQQNSGLRSHSFSYAGSHPSLHTQCGQRAGGQMKSTGVEGFLFYGPYIDLPAGRYKAKLYGQVKRAGTPNAFLEVLINSGADKLTSQVLTETFVDKMLTSVDFNLDIPAQVEVRVWVAADSEVSIRNLGILSEQDFSN